MAVENNASPPTLESLPPELIQMVVDRVAPPCRMCLVNFANDLSNFEFEPCDCQAIRKALAPLLRCKLLFNEAAKSVWAHLRTPTSRPVSGPFSPTRRGPPPTSDARSFMAALVTLESAPLVRRNMYRSNIVRMDVKGSLPEDAPQGLIDALFHLFDNIVPRCNNLHFVTLHNDDHHELFSRALAAVRQAPLRSCVFGSVRIPASTMASCFASQTWDCLETLSSKYWSRPRKVDKPPVAAQRVLVDPDDQPESDHELLRDEEDNDAELLLAIPTDVRHLALPYKIDVIPGEFSVFWGKTKSLESLNWDLPRMEPEDTTVWFPKFAKATQKLVDLRLRMPEKRKEGVKGPGLPHDWLDQIQAPKLAKLNLGSANLKKDGGRAFASLLRRSYHLVRLQISTCTIDVDSLRNAWPRSLRSLVIALDDGDTARVFERAAELLPNLRFLDLNAELTDRDCRALVGFPALTHFVYSGRDIRSTESLKVAILEMPAIELVEFGAKSQVSDAWGKTLMTAKPGLKVEIHVPVSMQRRFIEDF